MKKIEAIITPYILDAVRGMLNRRGCEDILLSEVRISHFDSTSESGHYRGNTYDIELPKIKIEAVVADRDAMPIAQAILHVSQRESSTDAKVSVCALEQVVSIGVSTVEHNKAEDFDDLEQTVPRKLSYSERLHA
jgi:nitrogen regulatory protein PII